MSTHGVIAFAEYGSITDNAPWEGRLHSSDSYPTALGRELWKQFRGHFGSDFVAARKYFVEDHPAGFSTIVGADLSIPSGYTNDYESAWEKLPDGRADFSKPLPHGARCFCHGDRSEEHYLVTHTEPAHYPWLYVFSDMRYTKELRIYISEETEGAEGVTLNTWKRVANIDLTHNEEPNWEAIECGEKFERCSHVAESHFPELSGTSMARLGVQTFLGTEPLQSHDICGIQIGARRFKCSSSGCAGNDGRGQRVWIASGVTPEEDSFKVRNLPKKYLNFSTYFGSGGTHYNGENRWDMIIAKYDKKGNRVPYPGITYLYPPTVKEPLRMFAELRAKLSAHVKGDATEDSLRRSALSWMFATGREFRDE